MRPRVGWIPILVASSAIAGPPEPRPSGLVEEVHVREVQITVTAWPKDGDPNACRRLTRDDFSLTVEGAATPILSLTPLGPWTMADVSGGEARSQPVPPPLQLVVLIDEFHHSCQVCALRVSCGETPPFEHLIGRHTAYEMARTMLREQFREGDRVLIVPFAFWPLAETGWLTDRDEAIAALDRIEQDGDWVEWVHARAHVNHWFEGMVTFMHALGQVRGTKDVLFPTCHFQLTGEQSFDVSALAAVAARNDVVLHTVDVLPNSCARMGDTIGPLASNLAGRKFGKGQGMSGAADQIRRMSACRFLLSFKPSHVRNSRIGNGVRVVSRNPLFEMQAPLRFAGPARSPTAEDAKAGLFAMPRFQNGLDLDVSFLPLGAAPNGDWDFVAIVHARGVRDDQPRPDPERLTLDVISWQRGGGGKRHEQEIEGDGLSFVSGAGARTFTFRFRAPAGRSHVTAVLHDGEGRPLWSAATRGEIRFPSRKAMRDAGAWFVASAQVRVADEIHWILRPNAPLRAGEPLAVLRYDCSGAPVAAVRLRREGDPPETIGLTFRPLATSLLAPYVNDRCRWLVGDTGLDRRVTEGTWTVELETAKPLAFVVSR